MANTVALNLGAGDQRVVFAPRPRNAPHKLRRASGHSPPIAGGFRPQRACSASPGPGEKWPLGALEGRVQGQGPRQITPRIEQVCGRTGEEADSRRFLRPYGGHAPPAGPTPRRTASRWAPGHRSMPLGEIQRLLKNQVAGRSLAPVFRSFDPRGEGRVRRRDFRRVLSECCCFLLTDREFERLWDHYSPDSADDMAYTDFLRKLEDSSPQNLALGPVCTRMDPPDPTRGLTNTQRQTLFHRECVE
ncbi:uncharacterized protein LOC130380479 [Gadus chalcogrammus]|uniref:uncharacterized protein LOC130380479 n=1 Tax=Gadus chalcogrammus TaxID=1042646 RepID=UPI0024C2A3D1|nr:uncharacterized protein LOC130380479 [Gadus chalcogrammus]